MSIYANQGYFSKVWNLFSYRDIFHLVCLWKDYDIVIDTEDYARSSSCIANWLGKNTIGFSELFTRKISYTFPAHYDDTKHACLVFLDLLSPLGIKIQVPEFLESYRYTQEDVQKVDTFLAPYTEKKWLCFHT
ncbi:MAG: hypothetical protein H6767_09755 [Candidatus Peribacteria bacterium]|nr:MAG: hypothetical protein H6767_09755 [Candidatus Peribacteria bacterium]